jgi:ubiquinone/menaquinone biosynthesis C-methylase UbiE
MTIAFDAHRFKTAAQHYVQGRLSYPSALIERVVSLSELRSFHRVLDLGCGPGFLAAAFAPHVREVVGIDPEPAMLEQAVSYAAERGVQAKFLQGSSYELGEYLGRFQLVTMGRSFHWMDRSATLEALSRLVAEDGAIALFSDSHLEVAANRWRKRFQSILTPFAEKDPAHGERRGNPAWLPHEAVLLDSKFNHLQRISVVQQIETPVERLLDRALSMSTTSPQRLGSEQERLLETLRGALNEEATNGVIIEVVESEALLAFRRNPAVGISHATNTTARG